MPVRRMHPILIAAGLVLVLATCADESSPAPAAGLPGDPLPGLTRAELARFEAGKVAFSRVFLPEEGLGPVYNENSCNACHSVPDIGGTGGGEYDLHATALTAEGECDLLEAHGGGNVRTQVVPVAAALGVLPERTPRQATARGFFTAPPMWGRGMVEAISDETLLALADPDDQDRDGISGRVGRDASGRVGRFRRKADVADLANIAEGAVLVEIGLTTPKHPTELVFSGPIPEGADPAPDPELDQATIDAIADYIRFLVPVAPEVPSDPAIRAQVVAGRQAFFEVGCADCHVEALVTGPNPVAALDRKVTVLWSNLLLHDMGPKLADVCGPAAAASELRTEPLAGMRYRRGYMHHGRAPTPWEAIAMHGGESAASRDAFNALPELTRYALVAFLLTL